MEGVDDILGARDGLLDAWGVEGGLDAVTRGLGEDYWIMGANFKFVRAGYPIHAVVEAAMKLVAEHKIEVGAITAVHVGMAATQIGVVGNREMHNICVQDMLAVALLRGGLRLRESYFPEILGDPGFAPMRARISVGVDPELERDFPTGRGANVSITTVRGSTVSHRIDWPRGHSQRGGVTWADLSEKWRDALPECDVDRMLGLAQRIEDIEDVTELVDLFKAAS
jgi:2-methylcitrate dehydratase PrpD